MREDTDPQGRGRQGQKDKDLPTEVLGLVEYRVVKGEDSMGLYRVEERWK